MRNSPAAVTETFTPPHPGGYDTVTTTVHYRSYTLDGQLHRVDGPARVWTDTRVSEWFVHGLRHRDDGPAIESDTINSWWRLGRVVDWCAAA